jgi:hypothetical protein
MHAIGGVVLSGTATSKINKIAYGEWNISKISENAGTEYVSGDSAFTYFFNDTGYYKITYTAYTKAGCADTTSVIVYSRPAYAMDVNIHAPNEICKNIETEIYATGAESYEWRGVKKIQSDTSAIIDRGGMYIVKGIDLQAVIMILLC